MLSIYVISSGFSRLWGAGDLPKCFREHGVASQDGNVLREQESDGEHRQIERAGQTEVTEIRWARWQKEGDR